MLYAVTALMEEIRVILDQNKVSTQLFDTGDIDTLTLDEIIRSKIVDATRVVVLNAPNHLLDGGVDGGKHFGESISWDSGQVGDGKGSIDLPSDFLRLICFQMSDWSRPVTEAINENHPKYFLQASRYSGIRGCPEKPVVAIVHTAVGLTLEFFSCISGEAVKVKKARYVALPKIDVNDNIEICEKLKSATVYHAASLVATTLKDTEHAMRLKEVSTSLMQ